MAGSIAKLLRYIAYALSILFNIYVIYSIFLELRGEQSLSRPSGEDLRVRSTPVQIIKKCSCQHRDESKLTDCINTECESIANVCKSKISEETDDHRLTIDTNPITMDDLILTGTLDFIQKGGWWSPNDCKSNHHIAIIIPMRGRYAHLPILLRHLLPLLRKKNKHFRVFVVEQSTTDPFNKAKLYNVGFKEALKYFPYTCFVFHDVDLLAESLNVMYGCEESPVHVSALTDVNNYKLIYDYMFSGVQMFTKEDYEIVNGFSNSFWHKGGEDDNMFDRVNDANRDLFRQETPDSKFTHIKHENVHWSGDKLEGPFVINGKRVGSGEFGKLARKHEATDESNSSNYKVIGKTKR